MTGKQRRYLRGLAHHLDPVVTVGRRSVSDSVVRQVAQALADHELVKVRVLSECPIDAHEAGAILAMQTESECVGSIGHVVLLYRADTENPRIELPDGGRVEWTLKD